jgi:CDP-6-deoxy-D-xylo-4-hexulose-3-dehydrase
MEALSDICDRHGLLLIEDCCEALGAAYADRPVGSFGRVNTFSFYFSHHITTIEGGMCVSDDAELADTLRILRAHGWIREVKDRERFTSRYPEVDPRFLFVNLGYNLRASELQGVFGLAQLPKLGAIVDTRRKNAAFWQKEIVRYGEALEIQQETAKARHSWFGIPVTVRETASFEPRELTTFLQAQGIETRPIICGNIVAQPGMKLYQHRVVGDLKHATMVMHRAFSFGNHQAIDEATCHFMAEQFRKFFADRVEA